MQTKNKNTDVQSALLWQGMLICTVFKMRNSKGMLIKGVLKVFAVGEALYSFQNAQFNSKQQNQ